MKAVNTIMACVDLSDYSKETMEYAFTLGRGYAAEIVFFSVVNSREVKAVKEVSHFYPHTINVEHYVDDIKSRRHMQIHELIRYHFPSARGELRILVRIGIPFQEILRAIENENVDLVVIGNKGRGNVIGTLFGSNAEKVFRHSPVPVFSVRSSERFSRKK